MNIIFFGTPKYVLPVVKRLPNLQAIVTQVPKPVGRKKELIPSPVENYGREKKIRVIYDLDKVPKADLGVVAAFGKILPSKVIKRFRYGIINIHPSLLPKYRGASPVQAAIANQEKTTGVTIIKMDAEMDHGPIITSFEEKILKSDTTGTLRSRLFERSAGKVIDVITKYKNKKVRSKKQNHRLATFVTPITKQDGFIPSTFVKNAIKGKKTSKKWEVNFIKNHHLSPTPKSVESFIRAMNPWPLAWTKVKVDRGEKKVTGRLKLINAEVRNNRLVLKKVQLEGKNPVTWRQFKEGYPRASFSS